MSDWWADQVKAELSQGDILSSLAIGVGVAPPVYLRHATMKGGASGWTESPQPQERQGKVHLLAAGGVVAIIVLSHDCEIDKGQTRVIVAPIKEIGAVAADHQQSILDGRSWAHVALPDLPGMGTCFADLRSTMAVDRANVSQAQRLASMTAQAVALLQARIVGFYVRKLPA